MKPDVHRFERLRQAVQRIPDVHAALVPITLLLLLGLMAFWDFTPAQLHLEIRYGIESSLYLCGKQLVYFTLGLFAMKFVRNQTERLHRYRRFLTSMVVVFLIAPHLPEIGQQLYGVRRSFYIGGIRISSGHWAVLLSLPLLSIWLSSPDYSGRGKGAPWCAGVWVMTVNVLLILQPNLPMMVLFSTTAMAMIMASPLNRCQKRVVAGVALAVSVLAAVLIFMRTYTLHRTISQYDWKSDPQVAGYQTRIALADIRAGGMTGLGYGSYSKTRQAYFRYIVWHTFDRFVLQIIARQYGLVGVAYVVSLFIVLAYFAFKSIRDAITAYERLLKIGALIFMLAQAALGMARTLNLLPLIPSYTIPFMGFGAHSLISACVAVGLVFSKTPPFHAGTTRKRLRCPGQMHIRYRNRQLRAFIRLSLPGVRKRVWGEKR